MKLNYKVTPEKLGGGAISGCGVILKNEISPTLDSLTKELSFPVNLNSYIVGSTGKREVSGDIDVVIDDKLYSVKPVDFYTNLENLFGKDNVSKNGNLVHLKFPISNFDRTFIGDRTGFVQIDFNFGSFAWEKFYHFSPGDASAYKGAHRNLAIAAICSVENQISFSEKDIYNRPTFQIRWKWSPLGFQQVNRKSIKDPVSGKWLKKQIDTIVLGPIFDPNKIARILLPKDGVEADLQSLETIILAVHRNYNSNSCENIFKRMAHNFEEWKDGINFNYPPEIEKYFLLNDK